MTGRTTIEWTWMPGFEGDVWNPTTGCTRVSAGCDNCYAFSLHDQRYLVNREAAKKLGIGHHNGYSGIEAAADAREDDAKLPFPKQYDLPFSHVQLLPDRLDAPLRKRKPTCYFVDSMADLFHEDVPDEFIAQVWTTMFDCPRHRFLILTKRPERMRSWVTKYREGHLLGDNIWLGTSVEDQASADERIPHLLATPAAVRFLSCEPLLGPAFIQPWLYHSHIARAVIGGGQGSRIDWVIVGGESGSRARPMDLAWARSLRDQCAAAGTAFFHEAVRVEA